MKVQIPPDQDVINLMETCKAKGIIVFVFDELGFKSTSIPDKNIEHSKLQSMMKLQEKIAAKIESGELKVWD